jgi:hypothetical protein
MQETRIQSQWQQGRGIMQMAGHTGEVWYHKDEERNTGRQTYRQKKGDIARTSKMSRSLIGHIRGGQSVSQT